jgi:hypothetical protein
MHACVHTYIDRCGTKENSVHGILGRQKEEKQIERKADRTDMQA